MANLYLLMMRSGLPGNFFGWSLNLIHFAHNALRKANSGRLFLALIFDIFLLRAAVV